MWNLTALFSLKGHCDDIYINLPGNFLKDHGLADCNVRANHFALEPCSLNLPVCILITPFIATYWSDLLTVTEFVYNFQEYGFNEKYENIMSRVTQWYSAGLRDGCSGVRVPAGAGNFSLHHRVQTGSGTHAASCPMSTWGSFAGGKAAGAWNPTTQLHLVPRSRMRGTIPPFPSTLSWRGA
jgi:hypothetical protein